MMRKNVLKIALIVLVVVFAIACTGCNKDGEKAYELYQSAVENYNAGDDVDMSINLNTQYSFGENNNEISVKADIMVANAEDNPTCLLYYETGENIGEVYYADNIAYITSGDDRYKVEVSMEELLQNYGGPVSSLNDLNPFMTLSEADFSKATITTEGSITKVSIPFSGDKFNSILSQSIMNSMGSGNRFGLNSDTFAPSDLTLTFSINQDGYFTGIALTTGVSVNMGNIAGLYSRTAMGGDTDAPENEWSQGNRGNREDRYQNGGNRWQGGNMEISLQFTMDITFNNPGAAVEIVPPNGLSQYEERTEDNAGNDNGAIDEEYTIPEEWRR